ncbi:snRNA-activating protein complex subunit 4-like [Hetaerina americana]|uniref:snRNA-activating protein complex subunit 4-like n=1 Tax=Hetaerina americana TaxID=62018 RepID=UPI003A7F3D72
MEESTGELRHETVTAEDEEALEAFLKNVSSGPNLTSLLREGGFDGLFSDDEFSEVEELNSPQSEETSDTLDKLYLSVLRVLSKKISSAINQLQEKRENLERKRLEFGLAKDRQPRKNWYHLFGSPYFKDKVFFPCSGNEDCYKKSTRNEINYHELPPIHRWKSCDQSKLGMSVRNNLIEIKKKKLKISKNSILKKLKLGTLTKEKEEIFRLELEDIDATAADIASWSTNKLLKDNEKELDWLRISVVDFDGQRSSEEIQAMWESCLHPSICRKRWTEAENDKLEEIASKYNMENWDQIAKELNTNRSSFQCFVQYQRNLNRNLRKSKWTEEEDNKLRKIIQECRVGDYIPWSKVALRMKERTKVQVYNRWTYSIDPMIRKGRFTPEEDCLIVAGVQRYGKDFPRISRFLPGRTSIQIRDRFIGSLQKVGPIGKWTREEDKLLMELVDKHGTKSWSKIVSNFAGRYRTQVRHRYLTLRRWMTKYPESSLQYAPSRYHGEYCNRQSNLWSQVRSILKSSLKKSEKYKEEEFREDSLLMLKRKLNMVNPRKCGRKVGSRKPFTAAELLLLEHTKGSHILRSGRQKFNFNEECHYKRKHTVGLLLDLFQVRLAFPFDRKVIEDDDTLDTADKYVLLSLKTVYDECIARGSLNVPSGSSTGSFGTSWIPLHLPLVTPTFPIDGDIPPSVGTVLGLRTAFTAKVRLTNYLNTPKEKVIALPAWRPPNLGAGEDKVKRISKEESGKLFAERLLSLSRWTYHLKNIKPQIHGNVFSKNLECPRNKEENVELPQIPNPKKCVHVVEKTTSCKSLKGATSKHFSEGQVIQKEKKGRVNHNKINSDTPMKKPKQGKVLGRKIQGGTTIPCRRSARLSNIQENSSPNT